MTLTQSPVFKTLLKMTVPMSWGIFSIIGFNLADTYFIGNLGKQELAAISLTFPVVTFFASIALGVATAGSSLVARALGEGNFEKVQRYTTDTMTLALALVVFFVILGFSTMDTVFSWLGATPELMPFIRDYMTIWFSGMVFVALPMAGNGAIRAQGDTKTASLIMMVAALANIILDPIMIFGLGPIPAMGMKGAALATVIARALTMVASLYFLKFKYNMLDFRMPKLKAATDSWREILYIGLPAAGANMITPISLSALTALVARMGEAQIAAFGVVTRVESFALIFILAISSSMGPLVGQNFGAHKIKRIHKALNSSAMLALLWAALMAFLLSNFGDLIMPLFNEDDEVIQIGVWYFQIVPASFGFLGLRLIACASFNAIGRPFSSSMLVILNLLVLYLPLAYITSQTWGMKGVFYSSAVSHLISGIISFFLIRSTISSHDKD